MLTAPDADALTEDAFVEAFGSVVEASPWVAEIVWRQRPFISRDGLIAAFEETLRGLTPHRQLEVIRAHPDLVGRAALAGSLSPDSADEQASAGLDRLSPKEVAEFQRLNTTYWQRFGFPFVICVRENRKQAILSGMTARLENARDHEIATAVGEICTIVRLRLMDRVAV